LEVKEVNHKFKVQKKSEQIMVAPESNEGKNEMQENSTLE